jgi:hypothetical protein
MLKSRDISNFILEGWCFPYYVQITIHQNELGMLEGYDYEICPLCFNKFLICIDLKITAIIIKVCIACYIYMRTLIPKQSKWKVEVQ